MASNFDEQLNQQRLGQHGLGLGPEKMMQADTPYIQSFTSGATRSADDGKSDYEGFLSFPAIEEFGNYMTRHRVQPNGQVRDSDNWQKGIPIASYVKSLLRHALELWGLHRGHISSRLQKEHPGRDMGFLKRETACAIFFNAMGFLHETLKVSAPPTSAPNTGTLDFQMLKKALALEEKAKQRRLVEAKPLFYGTGTRD